MRGRVLGELRRASRILAFDWEANRCTERENLSPELVVVCGRHSGRPARSTTRFPLGQYVHTITTARAAAGHLRALDSEAVSSG